jgi:hypothetical protein
MGWRLALITPSLAIAEVGQRAALQYYSAMIFLAAILIPFFGGLISGVLARGSWHRRLVLFFVLVCITTALFNVPFLLEMREMLQAGLLPLNWETFTMTSISQGLMFMFVAFVTAVGWLCAWCIQTVFED